MAEPRSSSKQGESSGPDGPATAGIHARVRIHLLGGFQVIVDDRVVPDTAWRTQKARSLVKLLALAPDHRIHREQALDVLWPDLEPQAAANNLRFALHAARRALEPGHAATGSFLRLRDDLLGFNTGDTTWIDVHAFEAAAATARRTDDPSSYQTAVELYTGDLLPEDRYEDWAAGRREHLRATYLDLLAGLARRVEARGDARQAIAVLERLVAAEPSHEEAHAGLMRLYAQAGQRATALRQYQRLRETLRQHLDVDPDPNSERLYAAILSGHSFGAEQPLAIPTASSAGRHNLPTPLTRLIGREHELARITEALAGTRLLTLTGVGGSGKTRLALALAHDLAPNMDAYPDGVWLVELATLSDPALVPGAVAQVLSVLEQPGRSLLDTLLDTLRGQRLLLVLDNCEHLVEACAQITAALLVAAPQLRILATSREAIRVPGELTWRVPPLTFPEQLPGPGRPPDAEQLLAYEAVRLFSERASFMQPDFTLTAQHADSVAQICQRLGGLPLAIELAAARVAVLSPQQIAGRLDDALGLLAGGSRTLPDRQQTLRATLDWSYDLLSEPERRLFERVSVFAGGWTLDAAESVAADDTVNAGHVLGLLAQLVDKSLVVVEIGPAGDARYRLLEPVRQYATERLAARGETEETQRRHVALYLALAEQAESGLRGARQAEWVERLETEHDNLRAALAWALEQDVESGARLATALWRFWYMHGHLREGREWLARACSESHVLPPSRRASVLHAAGSLAWSQADLGAARILTDTALELFRKQDDKRGIRDALDMLGMILSNQGEYEQARRYHEECLTLEREAGHTWGISRSLVNLGVLAYNQGDYDTAQQCWEESLEFDRALEDTRGVAITTHNIGEIMRARGDFRRARERFDESLSQFRQLDFKHGIAVSLANLAEIHLMLDDDESAARLLRASLDASRELGHPGVTATSLEISARLAAKQRQTERAATLFGAADALRGSAGAPASPAELAKFEPALDAVQAQLPDTTWSAAWSAGRAMTLEDAFALADDITDQISDASRHLEHADTPPSGLTRRERAIADLVAAGLTNQQIATQLGISTRTVETHISNILRKLGIVSRAEVRAWASEHQPTPDDTSSTF